MKIFFALFVFLLLKYFFREPCLLKSLKVALLFFFNPLKMPMDFKFDHNKSILEDFNIFSKKNLPPTKKTLKF